MKKILLFDWGNTIMRDFPNETGKMYEWNKVEAMPNAEKALQELTEIADCYIATNAKDSQKEDILKALQRVNLDKYFKDIFCYREIGHSKPSKEYFEAIIENLNVDKDNILMVGDSLESDIQGAQNYGIKAILYDLYDKHRDFNGNRIDDLIMIKELI